MPSYRIELIPVEGLTPTKPPSLVLTSPIDKEMGRFRDMSHVVMWLKDHRLCGSRRYNLLKIVDNKEIVVEDMIFCYKATLKLTEVTA